MTAILSKSVLFSKLLSMLLVLVFSLLPFQQDGMKMTVSENITASTQEIVVTCKNKTNREISFTPEYTVEKQTENGWEPLEFSEGYGVNEIYITLVPMLEYTFTVNACDLAEPLSPGNYRLIKPFNSPAATGCIAYAEFTVI